MQKPGRYDSPAKGVNIMAQKRTKKQTVMLISGLLMILVGGSYLLYKGIGRIRRDLRRQELMRENVVVEIAALKIKAPVLEGVGQEVLAEGAGHFPGTGQIGAGNYCIAGHSSVLYKEYFNRLKDAQPGMEIRLTRPKDGAEAVYTVAEMRIVNPDETGVLADFGDCRITLITCTDDGTQRLVVVGYPEEEASEATQTAANTGESS